MNKFLLIALFTIGLSSTATAAAVQGEYEGVGFTAEVSDDLKTATIIWDNGSENISLPYNPDPDPRPRCPCRIYEDEGRKLTILMNFDGDFTSATFEQDETRDETRQINGTWNGYGFLVTLSDDRQAATLTWDDGARGFTAPINTNPNPVPRCICTVYELGQRRIYIEYVGRSLILKNAIYERTQP